MWREPTIVDLSATLSEKEIEAYRNSINADVQDPVEDLLYRGASFVRGFFFFFRAIKLSPNEREIPESLVSPLCDYVAYDVLKRLPLVINEDRKRAREDALNLFKDVANGNLIPESYEVDEESIHARPSFNRPRPKRVCD